MRKAIWLGLMGACLLATGLAQAGTESGFFIGAGIGQAGVEQDLDIDEGSLKFDADDTGYKLFAGFNFGVLPFLDLAVEGGYVNLGEPDDTVAGETVKVEVSGFDAFGLAGLSFGPLGVFGKVGLIAADTDTKGAAGADDSSTDPAYGVGVRLALGSFAVRAEYEYFDIDDLDGADLLSASLVYTF